MTTQTPSTLAVPSVFRSVLAFFATEKPVGIMSVMRTNKSFGKSLGALKTHASAMPTLKNSACAPWWAGVPYARPDWHLAV